MPEVSALLSYSSLRNALPQWTHTWKWLRSGLRWSDSFTAVAPYLPLEKLAGKYCVYRYITENSRLYPRTAARRSETTWRWQNKSETCGHGLPMTTPIVLVARKYQNDLSDRCSGTRSGPSGGSNDGLPPLAEAQARVGRRASSKKLVASQCPRPVQSDMLPLKECIELLSPVEPRRVSLAK